MDVVAIASRKGGSGKTTLAGHIAVQAELSGSGPVALVDVDPQGSLASWWNERRQPAPLFVQTEIDRLAADIERLRGLGIELVVIDTPPVLTSTMSEVVKVADLVAIPTRPSPHDIRSVGATVELVEHLGKPLVFIVNAATARARITNETVTILSRYGTLAPAIIHHRVAFASSMIDGRTVMEIPGETRSVEEIAGLWSYLSSRLGGGVARRALPSLPGPMAAGGSTTAQINGGANLS
jgi:chromosome partitioning protein